MANLGTATVKVIPSDTINIPRPGIKHTGATDSNETSTELVPASVVPATTLNTANIGDTVYNTTGSTIGLVTGLNYTGTDITSLDTTIDFASGDSYEIYNSYRDSLIPPAVVAVSYTHLRAHETDSYLVCRLLLEKSISTALATAR